MNSSDSAAMIARNTCREEEAGGAKSFARRSSNSVSSCELLMQNYANFKRSSCPERFMFYEGGSWVDYPKEVEEVMKLGFGEGKPMVESRILGFNCVFDFCRMLEIDVDTCNQRSISWIDVDGKCFFPKMFVNSYEIDEEGDFVNSCGNWPKIEIDIKIREDSGSYGGLEVDRSVKLSKRKREDDIGKVKTEQSFSSTNAKKRQTVGGKSELARWPKARILGAEEKGYSIVRDLFLSGLQNVHPDATITSIHQCVRIAPLDKARREVFAKQMEITKRVRGESNMVFAWYGTSAKGVESILMNGFGVASEVLHSSGHGIGIHLSPIRSPQNSAMVSEIDENGEKHVILCRVILGKCEKVEAGSRQLYPSSVDYDTGIDDLNNPSCYTVWHANMNTHILPECVVSYRPVNISGSVNGASHANRLLHPSMFVAKLLPKLRSSLPPPRFQELQTLWKSLKEGKLRKDIFVKQLRSVVGDNMLRSLIQEIRG